MERKYGSLWKAVREVRRFPAAGAPAANASQRPVNSLFASLREGIGQLTKAIEKRLMRTQFITGTQITKISGAKGAFRVQARDGEAEAAAVIVAAPAHAAATMIGHLDPQLAENLSRIPYHSTMTVSLGFEEAGFGRALDGFGFVVPRGEQKRMVACTWVSTKYPFRSTPGRVLLRCFLGGARDPSINNMDDRSVLEILLRELGDIMGVRSQPSFTRIHRWDRAMPQYNVGHPGRIEQINQMLAAHPGLFLAGNGYKGIGIPDCIESASQAAASAFHYLKAA